MDDEWLESLSKILRQMIPFLYSFGEDFLAKNIIIRNILPNKFIFFHLTKNRISIYLFFSSLLREIRKFFDDLLFINFSWVHLVNIFWQRIESFNSFLPNKSILFSFGVLSKILRQMNLGEISERRLSKNLRISLRREKKSRNEKRREKKRREEKKNHIYLAEIIWIIGIFVKDSSPNESILGFIWRRNFGKESNHIIFSNIFKK